MVFEWFNRSWRYCFEKQSRGLYLKLSFKIFFKRSEAKNGTLEWSPWNGSLITTLLLKSLTFYCDDVVPIDSSGKNITMIFGEYSSSIKSSAFSNDMILPKPETIIFQNESFKNFKRWKYASGLGWVRFLIIKIKNFLVCHQNEQHRCLWRMSETVYVGEKFAVKIMLVIRLRCRWTITSRKVINKNIHTLKLPTSCSHQHKCIR